MLKGRFIELKIWKYCTIPKLWATSQKDKVLHNRIALLGEPAGAHQSGGFLANSTVHHSAETMTDFVPIYCHCLWRTHADFLLPRLLQPSAYLVLRLLWPIF